MSILIWILIILGISLIVGEILARFMKKKGDNILKNKIGMSFEDYYKMADKKAGEMAEKTINKFKKNKNEVD